MTMEQNAARQASCAPLDGAAALAFASPAVVAALGGGPLAVHETHAARVLVGRTHALKIKRPVRYDYLDFSTPAARRAALARELELNRPHAPDIYLRLVALTRAAEDALTLDGEGEVLDWALLMRRFEQEDVLSARLAHGRPLPLALCKALGDMVARYHAAAAVASGLDVRARMEGLLAELGHGLELASRSVLPPADVARWRQQAASESRRLLPLLEGRARAGCVLRCHGDLHAGNIVLWQGAPLAFDALEFDETLATIDTLYDLAFLIMDLVTRGHRLEANIVLNRYLWRTQELADLDGLAALPLFLSLRAAVRAMVGAQRCALEEGAARERDIAAARDYLAAGLRFLADEGPPRLVAIGGLSGTGKSTLGTALAPLLGRSPGALHLRSDLERKALARVEEAVRLPAASYTKASSDAVYDRLMQRAGHALRAGHSVLLDAVWLTREEQQAARDLAMQTGARFDGLWLTAPLDVLRARVASRTGDASDATADVVARQAEARPNPAGWPQIDAAGTPEATLAAACQLLDGDAADSCAGPAARSEPRR